MTLTQSDIPQNLGKPANRALEGAGYLRLEQVAEVSEKELMKLHGMGPKAIERLREALFEKGLSFSNE
ncbi:MAG: DNA-binding protein [Firmicutes bacterium]|nr:DNA-binding protein [Bacillota bacterium]